MIKIRQKICCWKCKYSDLEDISSTTNLEYYCEYCGVVYIYERDNGDLQLKSFIDSDNKVFEITSNEKGQEKIVDWYFDSFSLNLLFPLDVSHSLYNIITMLSCIGYKLNTTKKSVQNPIIYHILELESQAKKVTFEFKFINCANKTSLDKLSIRVQDKFLNNLLFNNNTASNFVDFINQCIKHC